MSLTLFSRSFRALGGLNELQIFASSEAEAQKSFDLLCGEVSRIEAKYSRYQPESVVSLINASAQGAAVTLDQESQGLISYAARCYEESDGLFDITSGILRRVWNFKSNILPNQSAIEEILPLIGWDRVQWNPPHIRLPMTGMEIDLGGIGKEYAVDRLAGICVDSGIQHALINLGGDVRVIGGQPSEKAWMVGIVHPRRSPEVLLSVPLRQGAVASSGDYERFIEVAGKRYCHILDPRTGWPVRDFQAVSIFSESCLIAGSVATIVMLLGSKRGRAFLKKQGLPSVLVDATGKVEQHSYGEIASYFSKRSQNI